MIAVFAKSRAVSLRLIVQPQLKNSHSLLKALDQSQHTGPAHQSQHITLAAMCENVILTI